MERESPPPLSPVQYPFTPVADTRWRHPSHGIPMLPQALRSRPERPLLAYLTMLLLAGALPAAAFSAMLLVRVYDQYWRITGQELSASGTRLVAAVDRELARAGATLDTLGLSSALAAQDYTRFYTEAEAVAQSFGAVITLADASGRPIFSTAAPYGVAVEPQVDAASVARAVASGTALVTGLIETQALPPLAYALVAPVAQGTHALVMRVPPQHLAEALNLAQMPAGWTGAVLDSSGRILWRSRDAARFIGARDPGLVDRLATPPAGIFHATTSDGTPVYAAWSKSALSDWGVLMSAPQAAIDGWFEGWLWATLSGGITMLVIGLAIAAVTGQRLRRALRELMSFAATLGPARSLAQPVAAVSEVSEFTRLGRTLGEVRSLLAQEHAHGQAAEAALRQSETSLRQAQQVALIGDWDWDFGNGAMRWSPAFYRILHLEEDSVPPSRANLIALIHPRDRAGAAAWLAALGRADAPAPIDLRMLRNTGEMCFIRCAGRPLHDEFERLVKIIGTVQDVTEQKRLEEALARARAAEAENPRPSERLRALMPNAAAAATLVEAAVEVAALIASTVHASGPLAAAAGIRLTVGLATDVRTVTGDEQRLKEALVAVIGNAIGWAG